VDNFGQKVLSRSGGPFDEQCGVTGRHHPRHFKNLLHGRVFSHHIFEGVSVADHLIQLLSEGQVLQSGQSSHDLSLIILERQVVGPNRNGFSLAGRHFSLAIGASLSIGYGFHEQHQIFGLIPAEQGGAWCSQNLTAVVAGNSFSRCIEEGDVPTPIDCKNADIQIIQNNLETAFLIMDSVDEIGEMRVVIEYRKASCHFMVLVIDRRCQSCDLVAGILSITDFNV